ncbi:MAG: hypothetical protein ABJF26_10160 [Lentilitoribacter sp.]
MIKVTNWYSWCSESESWQFNHQENGWSKNETPAPRFPTQKSWENSKWLKVHDYREPVQRTLTAKS